MMILSKKGVVGMSSEMQIAVIGIIGTLGGTVLGWLLNNLSQKGKLNIYLSRWTDEFQYNDNTGCMVPSSSMEQTECYGYKVSFDLYNSSRETKIMRNIHIKFINNKQVLYDEVPKDDYTKRVSHPMVYYDDATIVNVPAKSAMKLNLHGGLWRDKKSDKDNLEFIIKTNKIQLEYTDEKNKSQKVIIKKYDYKECFLNRSEE